MNGNRWALLVGACKYEFHPPLKFAASDATRFAAELGTGLGFDRQRMIVLADGDEDMEFRPTRRDLFHALGMLKDKNSNFYRDREVDPIAEDDTFVFYFSGHGIRREQDEFLLPVDASNYSVTETAVPLEEVVERIEKLPCRHKILFLDACREQFFQDEGAKAPAGAKGIGQPAVVDREGLATFYSCDPGQRSYEIENLAHGSFTYCLLEAIKHPQVNTLGELDDFLKSRVPQENERASKELQQPFSVPNPTDMLKLDLFRLVQASPLGDLIAMTTKLNDDGILDDDWWAKLCRVWESRDAPSFGLKQRIFLRLYNGEMEFEDFEKRWQWSEKQTVDLASSRPDLPFAQGGAQSGEGSATAAENGNE